jgi:hypothetical protein
MDCHNQNNIDKRILHSGNFSNICYLFLVAAPSHPILSFLKEMGIFIQKSNWQWRLRDSLVIIRCAAPLDPGLDEWLKLKLKAERL